MPSAAETADPPPGGAPSRKPASLTPPLSLLQTRVIGVLVEKEKTVPDTYPLSLNSLTAGCNQKNLRDPLMSATDAQVQEAVDALQARSLVIASSGARVARYSHNLGRVLQVPDQAVVLLAALMLRGAQTAAELRIGTDRLHRFADVSAVEGFLDQLASRSEQHGGALVLRLPRRRGEREQRWTHLLSGPPDIDLSVDFDAPLDSDASTSHAAPVRAAGGAIGSTVAATELAQLRAQQSQLADEVAELHGKLDRLARELGVKL